jgi:uncharacterized protein YdgA (DUF945 family)
MKKIVIVVLVMFVLLVAAPWGIGRLAEKRVNAGLDKFVEQAPYLTVVERRWTGGWFRSEQQVTFEVFGGWLDAMNPKNVLGAAAHAEANAISDAERALVADPAQQELERRRQSAVPGSEADVESEGPEATAPPEAGGAPQPPKPMRFTVRNEILHGPVLWPASLGLARVNSRLLLSDEVRQKLMEIFGTDEPVRISSRVGFFGGGSTRFFGDGRKLEFEQDGGMLAYDDFDLALGYSGDFDEVEMDGSWPRVEYADRESGERLVVSGMSLEGESERILGDVYDTDAGFEIDELRFTGADKNETVVDDVRYEIDTEHDAGFIDLSAKFGSGKVRNPAFEEMQLDIREIHYDFTARHLHVETLQKLIGAVKESHARPVATAADAQAAVLSPMQEHGIALLRHEPQFVIDRIALATAEGEGVIKGVVRLAGVTEADLAAGAMALVGKITADVNIEVAQKLLEKLPNGATGAGMAVDQGFARREGDKLVSRIEFSKGEVKVNGKPLPIPGLGAPTPPQDGYPAEEPPPSPQE